MPAKKKDENSKVLKGDELNNQGGFLSGLGFAPTEPEKEQKKEEVPVQEENIKEDDFAALRSEKISHFSAPKKKQPQDTRKRPPQRGDQQPVRKKDDREEKSVQTPVQRKPKKATTSKTLVKKQEMTMGETIPVKEFSEKTGIPLQEVLKALLGNKIMVNINSSLDYDTATLIGEELGVQVKQEDKTLKTESFLSGDLQAILELDKDATHLEERSPIVTVMGHVDHGKTSLLDYLRKTEVAEGEAGGITQSIGASIVHHNDQKIAFIDTPGHELFTTLRARGAKLTNVAVIVIAADDGLMPQTIESIDHAKAAGVPIVVAVTKIDLQNNNFEQIKADLGKHELIPEDRGGDVPVIGVSSKTGQGIPELLEAILLHSEMLELKYNPNRPAVGVILDAHKDAKQGVLSTIIVMTGTLKVGDIIAAYNTYGKVKRMQNWKGEQIKQAKGGEPVQILGISDLPEAGRIMEVVKNEKEAQKKVTEIQTHENTKKKENTVQQFLSQLQAGDTTELKLILKSDGTSSLEALEQAVDAIPMPDGVSIKVVHSDLGEFTESDLSLAQASQALMIGFNVGAPASLKKKAEQLRLEIKPFKIIYKLTEYLENLVQGMVEIEQEEVVIGKLDVMAIFFKKGKEMVLGGKITEGKVKNGVKFRILRDEEEIGQGEVTSLQKEQQSVKEITEGHECGMKVKVSKKIEEGDVLAYYEMQDKVS